MHILSHTIILKIICEIHWNISWWKDVTPLKIKHGIAMLPFAQMDWSFVSKTSYGQNPNQIPKECGWLSCLAPRSKWSLSTKAAMRANASWMAKGMCLDIGSMWWGAFRYNFLNFNDTQMPRAFVIDFPGDTSCMDKPQAPKWHPPSSWEWPLAPSHILPSLKNRLRRGVKYNFSWWPFVGVLTKILSYTGPRLNELTLATATSVDYAVCVAAVFSALIIFCNDSHSLHVFRQKVLDRELLRI